MYVCCQDLANNINVVPRLTIKTHGSESHGQVRWDEWPLQVIYMNDQLQGTVHQLEIAAANLH